MAGEKERGPDLAQTCDVIVVGAGFAGLTAAKILAAFGARPVVIEARERLGGRAHTDEFPAAPELGLPEPGLVEEGCNYLHGCGEDHPLFVLARHLRIPTAICPGDLGGRYSGWESVEVAEWHDASRDGERIPQEEVLDAVLLLEQAVCGIGAAVSGLLSKPPGDVFSGDDDRAGAAPWQVRNAASSCAGMELHRKCLPAPITLEDALGRSLAAVLHRRVLAGRRETACLTPREAALVRSIRGRQFGFVSACGRMPAHAALDIDDEHKEHIFEDADWPYSEAHLVPGVLAELRRKIRLGTEMRPEARVAEDVNDDGEDRLVLGSGFGAFIDFLAQGLEVHLGAVVQEVRQTDGGDEVHVRFRSGRVFKAPFAVITVPVGVLAGLCPEEKNPLRFEPQLPEEKLAAARRLAPPAWGIATHEKVVLRWEPSAPFVTRVLNTPEAPLQIETTDRRFHFLNLHRYGRTGQLLCHIWADAEWLEHPKLSDEEVVGEVVNALHAIYPAAMDGSHIVSQPRQWKVTRWAEDPLAVGAYSELQHPEASDADHGELARPAGRLHFAGEACVASSVGAQCTHGALLSGAAAALEVLERLQLRDEDAMALFDPDGPHGLSVGAVVGALVGEIGGAARSKRQRGRR